MEKNKREEMEQIENTWTLQLSMVVNLLNIINYKGN